jgi:LysR substrate binding domain-containing protein
MCLLACRTILVLNSSRSGLTKMVVVLPLSHPRAGDTQVPIKALADESWAEDNEGSAALLRQHAARAGVTVSIDLPAADLPGKIAMVATAHTIALVPGVLVSTPAGGRHHLALDRSADARHLRDTAP